MSTQSIKSRIRSFLPHPLLEALFQIRDGLYAEKIPDSDRYVSCVTGKYGIEIGGPSSLFKHTLPLYKKIDGLDSVNFSGTTIWEGNIKEGRTFSYYKNKVGFQYISDGTDLSKISDSVYDFVLSSNCLEHIANPLNALKEWGRTLKDDGFLILILPNKKNNFDHNRPTTSFKHILEDYNNKTSEHDLTHLEEILSLHDLSMDPPAGDIDNFKRRSLDNFNNRTLHHHVFDLDLMTLMIDFIGFKCLTKYEGSKNLFLLAVKEAKSIQPHH